MTRIEVKPNNTYYLKLGKYELNDSGFGPCVVLMYLSDSMLTYHHYSEEQIDTELFPIVNSLNDGSKIILFGGRGSEKINTIISITRKKKIQIISDYNFNLVPVTSVEITTSEFIVRNNEKEKRTNLGDLQRLISEKKTK